MPLVSVPNRIRIDKLNLISSKLLIDSMSNKNLNKKSKNYHHSLRKNSPQLISEAGS